MVIQSKIGNISDDTKIIRFLDRKGAEKSVGQINHREIYITFHYGQLRDYRIATTNAGDIKEGSTSINLGNGILGSDTTCNDALISCWSIWDGKDDPWHSFSKSSFATDKNNICVITSTVGRVRRIFNQTIEISKNLLGDRFPEIVFAILDGAVTYYPRKVGLDHNHWREITDPRLHGLGMKTIQNIFHKRDNNEKGQQYDAENEYRYSILLGGRNFFGTDMNIALNAKDAILRDFPLILTNGVHYIERVYLIQPNVQIEATCVFASIELVKKYEVITEEDLSCKLNKYA